MKLKQLMESVVPIKLEETVMILCPILVIVTMNSPVEKVLTNLLVVKEMIQSKIIIQRKAI